MLPTIKFELLAQTPQLVSDLQGAQHDHSHVHLHLAQKRLLARHGPAFARVSATAPCPAGLCRPLEPDVLVSTRVPTQGATVAVLVAPAMPRSPLGWLRRLAAEHKADVVQVSDLRGQSLPVFRLNRRVWRAFVPVTPEHQPGLCSIQVRVQDGQHSPVTIPIQVRPGSFPMERLWMRLSKAALEPSEQELAQVAAACCSQEPRQLWEGPFQPPSMGRMTAPYGTQRFYNGIWKPDYYHKGLDFAGGMGFPVQAPAAGRVRLARREEDGFAVHGNCVALDHGSGLSSLFLHLKDVAVREGDMVGSGDTLGTMGMTGMATGPHLHWGLFASGQAVDPSCWLGERLVDKHAVPIWKF